MARRLTPALRVAVTDLASGKAWIDALLAADLAFHFEDSPGSITNGRDGRPLFFASDEGWISLQVARLYALDWGPEPHREADGFWYCPIGYLLHREGLRGNLQTRAERDADPVNYWQGTEICGEVAAGIVVDRAGADPSYDYGAPGRYEVRQMPSGALVASYDRRTDAGLDQ